MAGSNDFCLAFMPEDDVIITTTYPYLPPLRCYVKMFLVNTLEQFVTAHYVAIGLVSAYLFTAAVAALPKPGSGLPFGSLAYQFIYDFAHVIANKVVERYPKTAPVVLTETVSKATPSGSSSVSVSQSVPAPNA